MPYAQPGETLNFSTSRFTKLSSKGDKLHFRILGNPFYDGKHFMKVDDEWDIKPCPRINEGAPCDICELFFKAHRQAKKEGLDQRETEKLTRDFKNSVSFYFPVLNRDTEQFEVFQTTQGVRNQIEAKREIGIKVEERDFIVLRTETPGSYYQLEVVDSAETKELTPKEKAESKKGVKVDLSEYVNGQEEEPEVAEDLEV